MIHEDEYDLAKRRAWDWRPGDTEVTDTERRVARVGIYTFQVPLDAVAEVGPVVLRVPSEGEPGFKPLSNASLSDLMGVLYEPMVADLAERLNRTHYGPMLGLLYPGYRGPEDPGDEHVPDPRFPRTEADACVTDLELLEFHLRDVNPENDGAARRLFAAAKLRRTTARDIEARLMRELDRED